MSNKERSDFSVGTPSSRGIISHAPSRVGKSSKLLPLNHLLARNFVKDGVVS